MAKDKWPWAAVQAYRRHKDCISHLIKERDDAIKELRAERTLVKVQLIWYCWAVGIIVWAVSYWAYH